jgi:hypothetical protein
VKRWLKRIALSACGLIVLSGLNWSQSARRSGRRLDRHRGEQSPEEGENNDELMETS